jgi:flagellar M-ring protein FliF
MQPKVERVGGIPGPRSTPSSNPANPAAAAAAAAAQADPTAPATPGDNRTKQNDTVNYDVSKAVRHVVNQVGKLDRMSVAVIIDNHTKVTTGQDGKPQAHKNRAMPTR